MLQMSHTMDNDKFEFVKKKVLYDTTCHEDREGVEGIGGWLEREDRRKGVGWARLQ